MLCVCNHRFGDIWAISEYTPLNLTTWGPLKGPHIAFVGGVAFTAYAAKAGKLKSGGKDIVKSLMGLNSPDVLVVGGIFGSLGYVFSWLVGQLPAIGGFPFTNGPAASIIITAFIVRLLFGKTGLFGKVHEGHNRWLPSHVAAWIPWQSKPLQLILIAIGWGLPIAFFNRVMPELFTFGFGLAAVALVFLGTGSQFPVFHHVGISAGMATIASGGNIWWGLAFALLAAFFGEFFAVMFVCHADTHIDPPAFAVVVCWILIALFSTTGLASMTGVIPIIVAAAVAILGYFIFTALQSRPHAEPAAE